MTAALPKTLPPSRYPLLTGVVALGLVQAATLIGTAWLAQRLLAAIVSGSPPGDGQSNIPETVALLIVLAAIGATCRWLERAGGERLGNRHVHDVRLALYDALAGAAAKRNSHGINMIRFSNDLNALRQWVALGIARTLSGGMFMAGVIVAVALIDPRLALWLAVGVTVSAFGLVLLGRGFEQSVRQTRRRRGGLATAVSDVLLNVPHLKFFGRTTRERRRLERLSTGLTDALETRALWIGALRGFTDFAQRGLLLLVLVYGAYALIAGRLDVAGLLAAVGVASLAATPLRDLSRVFEYWKSAEVAREKLTAALVTRGESTPGDVVRLRKGRGRLRLHDVECLPGAARLTAKARPGARIAIAGANGSGKTSLVNAIAGITSPAHGEIVLDGTRTDRLSDRHRRRAIGMASHRVPLVPGSISKNIRYRHPGATPEAVAEACRLAGLEQLLERLPEGLKTRLGQDGSGVSAGEAARIKLARALLDFPRLLLLDEIEQGLDASGFRTLTNCLETYPGTVVYATHDPTLVAIADDVWSLGSRSAAADVSNLTHLRSPAS